MDLKDHQRPALFNDEQKRSANSNIAGRIAITWPAAHAGAVHAGGVHPAQIALNDADTGEPITTATKLVLTVDCDRREPITVAVTMLCDADGQWWRSGGSAVPDGEGSYHTTTVRWLVASMTATPPDV